MGSIAKTKGFADLISTPKGDLSHGAGEDTLLLNQEAAILDTTELICELMKREGVTRADLARRLGKTKGYVSQLLDGSTNMTIRTVSDVLTNLGHEFRASCKARDEASQPVPVLTLRIKAQAEFYVGDCDVPVQTAESRFLSPQLLQSIVAESGQSLLRLEQQHSAAAV